MILCFLFVQGEVLIVSPRRGSSADHFIEKAQELFELECVENYDVFVWSSFCKVSVMSLSDAVVYRLRLVPIKSPKSKHYHFSKKPLMRLRKTDSLPITFYI